MGTSGEVKPVLCIGDMVADIFVSPLAQLPQPGESVLTDRIAFFPGGNALNAAVALRRLGDPAAMAGSVGDDALGTLLLHQLQAKGLDVRGVCREPGGTTAITLILRAEGEDRRFVSALGVGAGFRGEHVSPDLIPDDGIVLVGGYLKLPAWDDEILTRLLRQARSRNSTVVLNICIVQNSGVDPKRCLRLLEHVDVFVPNEDEARILTGQTEPARQAQVLRRAGTRLVVITRGPEGLYADDGERTVTMDAFLVPMVDPSGCGDCFTAGLLAALRRGWDTVPMLEFGSAVGALGATAQGCTNGVPSFADVERFVRENDLRMSVRPVA
ncbi:MAG: carbohydrate kinase family protein [Sedimentisphaerales bacterium]|nr:carbohydrate kinase family protein [Sedimentisphaerales bacterium]